MDFSLRVNRKQIATNSSPYRDQQFQQYLLATGSLPAARLPHHQRR